MADTLELIKALPLELREKILNEYIKIKLWQRKMLGWEEVYKEFETIPFCERRERFVKTLFCFEHLYCGVSGICAPCSRKENINHYVIPPIDNSPSWYIEICDDELEHEWIKCKIKGLDPVRELLM